MSASESIQTDVLIVGAGVVGLAIAAELPSGLRVLVIEKNSKLGQETSSRNSEVIHSGIYYPPESKKTEWCLKGRERLYDYCKKNEVPVRQCGKLVVASEVAELSYLDKLAQHCEDLIVPFHRVSKSWLQSKEPLLAAEGALFFPQTGIIDSHALMKALERQALEKRVDIAYRHRVTRILKNGQWSAEVESPDGTVKVGAKILINAAGLGAADLSNLALGTKRYEHRFCRGRYFTLPGSYRNRFRCLVYPVPQKDGLGVHVTLDLDGFVRLGPDVDWCLGTPYSKVDDLYECDWESLRPLFRQAAARLIPDLHQEDLQPGLIGVRPKLFIDGVAHSDFLVENKGGFIHCLGIESPGLTASLAIADQVKKWVGESV